MKYIFISALALTLTGCATNGAGDTSPKTQQMKASTEKPYTNDEMMALMFSAAPRNDAKTLARIERAKTSPLGDKANPVRTDSPRGQKTYLSRLNCASGATPTFNRMGSFGPGPYETIIDGYKVECAGSAPATSTIFMDMYFPSYAETQAVKGFTIDAP